MQMCINIVTAVINVTNKLKVEQNINGAFFVLL